LQQLLLDLGAPPPAFDNFQPGRNAEALAALRRAAAEPAAAGAVYLWGVPGAGKSHLLRAAVAAAAPALAALYVDGRRPGAADRLGRAAYGPVPDLVALDHVEALDEAAQVAAFHLYNAGRECGAAFVAAGPVAPAALAACGVRADLATRLAWGLVFEVRTLDDDEKRAALAAHAARRGWQLPAEVGDYLLRHHRRDLPSLLALLDRIEQGALARKRAVTLPLVRDMISA
jgi:DnaA family protein